MTTRRKPGRPSADWEEAIRTGIIYKERRGRDFKSSTSNRRIYIHRVARERGVYVTTRTRGDEIRFQFRSTE